MLLEPAFRFKSMTTIFSSRPSAISARASKNANSPAVELIRAFAEQLETLGPRYNALALPLTKVALHRAKRSTMRSKRERFSRASPQGIPFGAKDLLSFAGFPTTWGAKPYASQVFDETATVLRKAR